MPQELDSFTIVKKISDLRLVEDLSEVYCYMDFNKQTIEPMYNDEIRMSSVNIIKLVQKRYTKTSQKIPTKKAFSMIKDVKIEFDPKKSPDTISFHIWMNI